MTPRSHSALTIPLLDKQENEATREADPDVPGPAVSQDKGKMVRLLGSKLAPVV